MYTNKQLGIDLLEKLNNYASYAELAYWAETIIANNIQQTPEGYDIIEYISRFDLGPEFLLTKKELRLLAEKLIAGEKDAFEQVLKG